MKVLHFVLTELSDSKEREKLIEELREIFTKEKVSVLNKNLFRKSKGGTVGARIPNIRIPNTFKFRAFQNSEFEWFGFRMDHSKTELSKWPL